MALVQPTVIDLLPDDYITLNATTGLGSSDTYTLVTVLYVASANPINVDLKVVIRDPALYAFTDGTHSKSFRYNNQKDNDTVDPTFQVKNLVDLTGAPIRFRVETNDVSTPNVTLADTSEHDIVYKP